MKKEKFVQLMKHNILLLDGATGSNLQRKGMEVGVCPETWILEHKEIVIELQKEYIQSGSDIIYAPTFTSNRIKLAEYGLEEQIEPMNQQLVELSKKAVQESQRKDSVYIAGDLTMTGEQLYPIGTLTFEKLIEVYKEQVSYLVKAGVDLFVVETMMSLQECRAALLAIKEICDLPIFVTLTFQEDGRTLYGTDGKTAMVVLQNMGADAVGLNCSTGPDKMLSLVEEMKEYATIPIIAKPNAGMPYLEDGVTCYNMEPKEFALEMEKLVKAGVSIVGGCCGTTPEHIKALKKRIQNCEVPSISTQKKRVLTTERVTLPIELDHAFMIVGERINPTGKKALQAELKEGKLDIVRHMAQEQEEQGASILDINVGMNGINEKEMMKKVIEELTMTVNIPLCIDSSYIDVIEEALRIYPGRALINSISFEKEKLEALIPIAKKYGAMFVLLPLSDKGLPETIEEKKKFIHAVLDRALKEGMTKEDIIVDGLVATVGANKRAAIETLETIRYCKEELCLATICGLSNISFGLPERTFINSTFLALAIQEGLTMAIANPSQDLLMNTAFAADLLLAKEAADLHYIHRVSEYPISIVKGKWEQSTVNKAQKTEQSGKKENNPLMGNPIFAAVVKGEREKIIAYVQDALEQKNSPDLLLDTILIPAINKVGELFNKKEYFLPQLIASAETMKKAIDYLEPMLLSGQGEKKLGIVIMATVEGDIHDIGKNLVVMMLKNYGFDVIDLGKDVSTELIIQTAKEKQADIIGLSALMTTTMIQMKEVIKRAKEEKLKAKIMIGGAVITQSFADEIGADGYSKDAQEAVVVAKRLLGIK